MDEKIRVLIIDDHPLMRQALLRMLHGQEDIEVVGEGNDGVEAVEKAKSLSPDVIIMDLLLPVKSGVQAISEITKQNSSARILVFSGMEDQSMIMDAIQSGAVGFLPKASRGIDIINAVRQVHQGMTLLNADMLRHLLGQSQATKEKIAYRDILTERELEIVELISEGVNNQAIAKKLFLADSTVRSHINHILSKLNLKSRAELIRFVLLGRLDEPFDE